MEKLVFEILRNIRILNFSYLDVAVFSVCRHMRLMTIEAVQALLATHQLKLAPTQTLQSHCLTPDLRFYQ